MYESLLRGFEKAVRRLFKKRGGIIENENQPLTQVESAATIGAIFDGDVQRQEFEHMSRSMPRIENNSASLGGPPNAGIGTVAGISVISFNSKRK